MIVDHKDEDNMQQQMKNCIGRLQKVEEILNQSSYFNGEELALIDAAYAPLLIRLEFLNKKLNFLNWEPFPNLNKWKQNLLGLESVQKLIIDDFRLHYTKKIKGQNGHLATIL